MNRLVAATTLAAAALLLAGVGGCERGPSDFFRSMDRDQDGSVDLKEWMAYYGPHQHDWARCSGRDFEPADCDGDLRLSWSEYHAARFGGRYCDSASLTTVYSKPVLHPGATDYALVAPKCRIAIPGNMSTTAIAGSAQPLPLCPPK